MGNESDRNLWDILERDDESVDAVVRLRMWAALLTIVDAIEAAAVSEKYLEKDL